MDFSSKQHSLHLALQTFGSAEALVGGGISVPAWLLQVLGVQLAPSFLTALALGESQGCAGNEGWQGKKENGRKDGSTCSSVRDARGGAGSNESSIAFENSSGQQRKIHLDNRGL